MITLNVTVIKTKMVLMIWTILLLALNKRLLIKQNIKMLIILVAIHPIVKVFVLMLYGEL